MYELSCSRTAHCHHKSDHFRNLDISIFDEPNDAPRSYHFHRVYAFVSKIKLNQA